MCHFYTYFYVIKIPFVILLLPCRAAKDFTITETESTIKCPRVPNGCNVVAVQNNELITRQLYHRLRLWQVGLLPPPQASPSSPNISLSLLELGTEVAKTACPSNYISPHILDTAFRLFTVLHGLENRRYYGDRISESAYARIFPALTACQEALRQDNFYFDTDFGSGKECPNPMILRICRSENEETIGIKTAIASCQPLKPKLDRYTCPKLNLIVEVMWNVVELVQAACLSEFGKYADVSLYHAWEQAQEELFTRDIKKYWYESEIPLEVYQTILDLNILQGIENLEKCVEGMYQARYLASTSQFHRGADERVDEIFVRILTGNEACPLCIDVPNAIPSPSNTF